MDLKEPTSLTPGADILLSLATDVHLPTLLVHNKALASILLVLGIEVNPEIAMSRLIYDIWSLLKLRPLLFPLLEARATPVT